MQSISEPASDGTLSILSRNGTVTWERVPHLLPIFSLAYADGGVDGQGYYEVPRNLATYVTSGTIKVREGIQLKNDVSVKNLYVFGSTPGGNLTWRVTNYATTLRSSGTAYLDVPEGNTIFPLKKNFTFPICPNADLSRWAEISMDGGKSYLRHPEWDWPVYAI